MFSEFSELHYLKTLLDHHLIKARSERGASAVEWVVITALLVGIALALAVVIRTKIMNKADSIELG